MLSGGKHFVSTKNNKPKIETLEEEDNTIFKATSLITCLKPSFLPKTEKHGSDNIEGFLTAVENHPQIGFPMPMLRTLEQ